MNSEIVTRMKRATVRLFPGAVLLALLALFLPACTGPAEEQPAAGPENAAGDSGATININRFAAAQDAEMDHFVEAVDEDLFVGVAVGQQEAGAEEARRVAVYVCDGQTVSQWISEEITGEEATLVAGDTSVDLTIAEERVAGTVAVDGGAPQPFTAGRATGDAGLYRAEWTLAGADYQVDWIILDDGRQRGGWSLDGKGNDVIVLPP